jgi:hypothetical protein
LLFVHACVVPAFRLPNGGICSNKFAAGKRKCGAYIENTLSSRKINWKHLRHLSWIDTRARFVEHTPFGSCLLDNGSADGETLGHFAELRPDVKLFATDLTGSAEKYPPVARFIAVTFTGTGCHSLPDPRTASPAFTWSSIWLRWIFCLKKPPGF